MRENSDGFVGRKSAASSAGPFHGATRRMIQGPSNTISGNAAGENELGPGFRRDDASVLISTLVPRSDSERFSAASGYFYPVIPAQAGIQKFAAQAGIQEFEERTGSQLCREYLTRVNTIATILPSMFQTALLE